ncbi:hypothetical protein A5792_01345 [Mycolicibacterium peregrinum]|uniref:Uncharacterized protein n=1 Tax=Mycolicibacterium peregrinum TaxID=43304 RepID=A0A1A0RE46_MYCPR|nr:hypothetical protein A5792_01345 [Mycolicibacterium peregrinum]
MSDVDFGSIWCSDLDEHMRSGLLPALGAGAMSNANPRHSFHAVQMAEVQAWLHSFRKSSK